MAANWACLGWPGWGSVTVHSVNLFSLLIFVYKRQLLCTYVDAGDWSVVRTLSQDPSLPTSEASSPNRRSYVVYFEEYYYSVFLSLSLSLPRALLHRRLLPHSRRHQPPSFNLLRSLLAPLSLSPRSLLPHVNASSGIQNVTKKLKDPELTQKVSASAAWGWGAISTQAGTLWSKAAETVGAISEG